MLSDGEQRKYHNFWTYWVHGLDNTDALGFQIPFSAGHTRRMPRLTAGPLRYADSYLELAMRYASVPVKQAVISPGHMVCLRRSVRFVTMAVDSTSSMPSQSRNILQNMCR